MSVIRPRKSNNSCIAQLTLFRNSDSFQSPFQIIGGRLEVRTEPPVQHRKHAEGAGQTVR